MVYPSSFTCRITMKSNEHYGNETECQRVSKHLQLDYLLISLLWLTTKFCRTGPLWVESMPWLSLALSEGIWLISHKSHNAPVPYPTMHHSEQKCAVTLWDIGQVHGGTCDLWLIYPLVMGGFPSQRAINVDSVFMSSYYFWKWPPLCATILRMVLS